MHQHRAAQLRASLQLGEHPVHVEDVGRTLDLRDHDHVEPVSDLGDQRDQVVQRPRRVEAVHPRPERRGPDVLLASDLDQPLARGDLVARLDSVLEVSDQHISLGRQVRDLGRHLRVARVEEVDHPRRPGRYLAERLRRAERQRREEVLRGTHNRKPIRAGAAARRAGERRGLLPTEPRGAKPEPDGGTMGVDTSTSLSERNSRAWQPRRSSSKPKLGNCCSS